MFSRWLNHSESLDSAGCTLQGAPTLSAGLYTDICLSVIPLTGGTAAPALLHHADCVCKRVCACAGSCVFHLPPSPLRNISVTMQVSSWQTCQKYKYAGSNTRVFQRRVRSLSAEAARFSLTTRLPARRGRPAERLRDLPASAQGGMMMVCQGVELQTISSQHVGQHFSPFSYMQANQGFLNLKSGSSEEEGRMSIKTWDLFFSFYICLPYT